MVRMMVLFDVFRLPVALHTDVLGDVDFDFPAGRLELLALREFIALSAISTKKVSITFQTQRDNVFSCKSTILVILSASVSSCILLR